jgi:hypothetical protein
MKCAKEFTVRKDFEGSRNLFQDQISGSHGGEVWRLLSSGLLRRIVWLIFTDILEVLTASIIVLMMEAASTSETLSNFYQTTRQNP